jgi:hypothetical protein
MNVTDLELFHKRALWLRAGTFERLRRGEWEDFALCGVAQTIVRLNRIRHTRCARTRDRKISPCRLAR